MRHRRQRRLRRRRQVHLPRQPRRHPGVVSRCQAVCLMRTAHPYPAPASQSITRRPEESAVRHPTCPITPQFCWLLTRTNEQGEYSVEFNPRQWTGRGFGFVYALRDGYQVDVQWVPTSGSPALRDMQLRHMRSIAAGESIDVSVDGTSPLCTDLEDLWAMESRCETVAIGSGAGMLHVEARPDDGGPAPTIFLYTSGRYAGAVTRPAPGAVLIPVRDGMHHVMVGIPEGAPTRHFNVTTTLQ